VKKGLFKPANEAVGNLIMNPKIIILLLLLVLLFLLLPCVRIKNILMHSSKQAQKPEIK